MERFLSTIIILFSTLCLSAQYQCVPTDTLQFAHFEYDTLSFDRSNSLLIPFFQKFDSVVQTQSGNINIVQIGGSHVQAGTMSHRIRQDLLITHPELLARRGMIFPYSAAQKCNNPHDYAVSKSNYFSLIRNVYKEHPQPLGLTGIAVYTSDSIASIRVTMKDSNLHFVTDRIILLGVADSSSIIPFIKVDSTFYQPVSIDTQLRRFVYDIPSVSDSFSIYFPCDSMGTFTLTGILLDNDNPGITFHSIGVNGADLPSYLRCPYFVPDLELVKPDLVIFGIGINDCKNGILDTLAFKNNYLQLIDSIKRVNPDCAFIFITNNDSYKRISRGKYTVNRNGLLARSVFYRLSEATHGAVWDQFMIMGGLKSMEQWRIAKYAKNDRIHFTNKGYTLLGDLFYNAFISAYHDIINKQPTANHEY